MPDVGALNLPGASAESAARHRGAGDSAEGLRGLKALGVRDLNYRMSFLACGVSSAGRDSILFGLGEGPILSIILRIRIQVEIKILLDRDPGSSSSSSSLEVEHYR